MQNRKAMTKAQVIALLEKQLAATTNPVEKKFYRVALENARLMPTTCRKVSQARADAIIRRSKYFAHVEESEVNHRGYVYGLDNGKAVVVTFQGKVIEPR